MPKVAVLSLGGTIAMGAENSAGGVTPSLTVEDLIAAVPCLEEVADITTFQICNLPSPQLSLAELLLVRAKILELEAQGFDGVVITQGTDTIEETSWILDLICPAQIGVIVTGAMRNPTQAGADGPANLLASVQVAASNAAKKAGTFVVFNDQIHAARFVQKNHTSNVAAFTSPICGPVGWMAEGVAFLPFQLTRTKNIELPSGARTPRVSIVKPGLGEDGALIDAAVSSGVDGIVIEASGGGHVSEAIADAAQRAAKEMPVILSSRTRAGNVLTGTYGFVGSEMDLLSRGLISSGFLDALKARIIVVFSLMRGDSTASIARRLEEISACRSARPIH